MKKRILFLVCLLPLSLFAQKKSRLQSILVAYPFSWDFSVQDPDDGKKFRNITTVYSAFDVQAVVSRPGKMTIETGYRFKQHWLTYTSRQIESSDWTETTHSIPIKWRFLEATNLPDRLNRFSFIMSAGFLLDIMGRYPGAATGKDAFGFTDVLGSALITSEFKPGDTDRVKYSVSLDIQGQINIRLTKQWYSSVGYGYTQGVQTLARGRYTYETTGAYGPPFFESGSMLHRGSYTYLKIGLGYRFLEKGQQ